MEPSHIKTNCFEDCFAAVLAADHPDSEKRETLASLGLPSTILAAVALGVALKAAGGDVSAAKFLREVSNGGKAAPDTDLAPYTDEELRTLIRCLQEDTHDTARKTH